jgi:hypothetical protein
VRPHIAVFTFANHHKLWLQVLILRYSDTLLVEPARCQISRDTCLSADVHSVFAWL